MWVVAITDKTSDFRKGRVKWLRVVHGKQSYQLTNEVSNEKKPAVRDILSHQLGVDLDEAEIEFVKTPSIQWE